MELSKKCFVILIISISGIFIYFSAANNFLQNMVLLEFKITNLTHQHQEKERLIETRTS